MMDSTFFDVSLSAGLARTGAADGNAPNQRVNLSADLRHRFRGAMRAISSGIHRRSPQCL
jgi:hypothetical protein